MSSICKACYIEGILVVVPNAEQYYPFVLLMFQMTIVIFFILQN
jgi:hypothetical protein